MGVNCYYHWPATTDALASCPGNHTLGRMERTKAVPGCIEDRYSVGIFYLPVYKCM